MNHEVWRPVSSAQLQQISWVASEDQAREHFARIAISSICEPADKLSSLMIQKLGALNTLSAIVDRTPAAILSGLMFPDTPGTEKLTRKIAEGQLRWQPRISLAKTLEAIECLIRIGAKTVIPGEAEYSTGLLDLGVSQPPVLYALGAKSSAQPSDTLAVIGARDSTSYGRRCVTEFVGFAVESGVTIISGGAVGIDAQAHLNAIENSGTTIAYLAGGLDQLYPVENIGLFQAITANGSIFTEQPPGAKPTKWRFLNRNRLIAASAGSTLVVEASWRSGSINTANHALELGRNVGVVPGSIFEPGSQGIFRLAKTPGVQMISQVEDLRTLLGLSGLGQVPLDDLPIGENALRAKDALSSISKTSSEIAIEAGLANFEAEVALSTLQTLGFAQRTAAGWRLSAKSKTNL